MEKKITKAQVLKAVAALVKADAEVRVDDVVVTGADVAAYVNTTLDQLTAKAVKAKERAAEKRAEGDALRDAVEAALTDEYQIISDIAAKVDAEDITNAKVSARLTQLVRVGKAHKTQVKVDNRKLTAYAAGPAPAENAE